jgi:RNA polymerase sigma-70 factor (ECF subfamily)
MDDGRTTPDASVPSAAPRTGVESTSNLIDRAKAGDRKAAEVLFERYLPRLRRWASGRLPRWARDITDTHDVVQETLLQTFRNIEGFERRGELALQAYLRQAVSNRVRDELRRHARRPGFETLASGHADEGVSPLDAAIGSQAVERYEAALERLKPEERELIVARVEMGYTYQELADAVGKPTPEAARKSSERALVRLAEEMRRAR